MIDKTNPLNLEAEVFYMGQEDVFDRYCRKLEEMYDSNSNVMTDPSGKAFIYTRGDLSISDYISLFEREEYEKYVEEYYPELIIKNDNKQNKNGGTS